MKKYTLAVLAVILCLFALLLPQAKAATASFAWDPNTESDLAGYKFYVGNASRVYSTNYTLGLVTTLTITNLLYDTTYFYAVTAYNTSNLESEFSNEVSSRHDTPVAPPVPTGIAAVNRGRAKAGLSFNYSSLLASTFSVYTNGALMLSAPKPATAAVVIDLPGLLPAVSYSVQVSAVGTNALESARSTALNLRIPGTTSLRRN